MLTDFFLAGTPIQVAAAKEAFKLGSPWRTMDAGGRRDRLLKLADLKVDVDAYTTPMQLSQV